MMQLSYRGAVLWYLIQAGLGIEVFENERLHLPTSLTKLGREEAVCRVHGSFHGSPSFTAFCKQLVSQRTSNSLAPALSSSISHETQLNPVSLSSTHEQQSVEISTSTSSSDQNFLASSSQVPSDSTEQVSHDPQVPQPTFWRPSSQSSPGPDYPLSKTSATLQSLPPSGVSTTKSNVYGRPPPGGAMSYPVQPKTFTGPFPWGTSRPPWATWTSPPTFADFPDSSAVTETTLKTMTKVDYTFRAGSGLPSTIVRLSGSGGMKDSTAESDTSLKSTLSSPSNMPTSSILSDASATPGNSDSSMATTTAVPSSANLSSASASLKTTSTTANPAISTTSSTAEPYCPACDAESTQGTSRFPVTTTYSTGFATAGAGCNDTTRGTSRFSVTTTYNGTAVTDCIDCRVTTTQGTSRFDVSSTFTNLTGIATAGPNCNDTTRGTSRLSMTTTYSYLASEGASSICETQTEAYSAISACKSSISQSQATSTTDTGSSSQILPHSSSSSSLQASEGTTSPVPSKSSPTTVKDSTGSFAGMSSSVTSTVAVSSEPQSAAWPGFPLPGSTSYNYTTTVYTHTSIKTVTTVSGVVSTIYTSSPVTEIETITSCEPSTKTVNGGELTKTTMVSYLTTGKPVTKTITYIDATSTTTVCRPAFTEPPSGFTFTARPTGSPPWGTALPPWGYYGPPPWITNSGEEEKVPQTTLTATLPVQEDEQNTSHRKRDILQSFVNEDGQSCEIIATAVPKTIGKRDIEGLSIRLGKQCVNGICDTGVYCIDASHVSEAPPEWGWGTKELVDGQVCIDDVVYEKSFVRVNCECAGM